MGSAGPVVQRPLVGEFKQVPGWLDAFRPTGKISKGCSIAEHVRHLISGRIQIGHSERGGFRWMLPKSSTS
jgi:hypothetical protein